MRTLPYRRLQLSRAFDVCMRTVLRPEQTFNDVAELDIATASYAIRGDFLPRLARTAGRGFRGPLPAQRPA